MSGCRKIWLAGMTLHAKLSLPIMDCKSCLVALQCDSHWGILSIRFLSFSGGNLVTGAAESGSIHRKVMVVVGPVSLLGSISTLSRWALSFTRVMDAWQVELSGSTKKKSLRYCRTRLMWHSFTRVHSNASST